MPLVLLPPAPVMMKSLMMIRSPAPALMVTPVPPVGTPIRAFCVPKIESRPAMVIGPNSPGSSATISPPTSVTV
jgi:hypothetical protein